MAKPKITYSGVCGNCGRESHYMHRDHRHPVRLGGSDNQSNLQDLCLECHYRKTFLETILMTFNCETAVVREWFQLAFQKDAQKIKTFVNHMAITSAHLDEVYDSLFLEQKSNNNNNENNS